MLSNSGHKRLGKVIERCPEKYDVVHLSSEIEGLVEKALGVVDGLIILIGAGLPVAGASFRDKVGQKDAVSQAGEIVDIGRRCRARVDDAETRFALKTLAQRRPATGMTRNSRPTCSCSRRIIFLALIEPTANQLGVPL